MKLGRPLQLVVLFLQCKSSWWPRKTATGALIYIFNPFYSNLKTQNTKRGGRKDSSARFTLEPGWKNNNKGHENTSIRSTCKGVKRNLDVSLICHWAKMHSDLPALDHIFAMNCHAKILPGRSSRCRPSLPITALQIKSISIARLPLVFCIHQTTPFVLYPGAICGTWFTKSRLDSIMMSLLIPEMGINPEEKQYALDLSEWDWKIRTEFNVGILHHTRVGTNGQQRNYVLTNSPWSRRDRVIRMGN